MMEIYRSGVDDKTGQIVYALGEKRIKIETWVDREYEYEEDEDSEEEGTERISSETVMCELSLWTEQGWRKIFEIPYKEWIDWTATHPLPEMLEIATKFIDGA